jgi:copper transport protein
VPEVTGALTLPDRGIGPLPVALGRRDAGSYAADQVNLPMAGTWRLKISVRTSEIDVTTVQTQLTVT